MITEINGQAAITGEDLESLQALREDLISLVWTITEAGIRPEEVAYLANIICLMCPEGTDH